ncbi:hypothetical protein WN944_009955 [Citrus x changshan-huyou]|uniref:RRM domain-containing protein n=1 Tax=Citrus x changshan-huyou TaxID=2935761 RepID=A0AAP0MQR0_9ROSI
MSCSSATLLLNQLSVAETCFVTNTSKTLFSIAQRPFFFPLSAVSSKQPINVSFLATFASWEIGGFIGGEESFGDGSEVDYSEPPEDAKLFVGNLRYDVDSDKLAHLFNQAGVVEISEVIFYRETDRSTGFGFVTMSTVEEAEKAVEMFNRYVSFFLCHFG